jgi:hypothetical protein
MSRLTDKSCQANHAQIASFAPGMTRRASSPAVVVAMCVSKLVVSNASTQVDKSKRSTAARAIEICAFSSCSSVTFAANR